MDEQWTGFFYYKQEHMTFFTVKCYLKMNPKTENPMTDFFQSILDNIKINIPKEFNNLEFDVQSSSDNKRCSITVAVADEFCADPILTIRAEREEQPMFCRIFAHKWNGDILPINHFSQCITQISHKDRISMWIDKSVKTAFSNISP